MIFIQNKSSGTFINIVIPKQRQLQDQFYACILLSGMVVPGEVSSVSLIRWLTSCINPGKGNSDGVGWKLSLITRRVDMLTRMYIHSLQMDIILHIIYINQFDNLANIP